MKPQLLQFDGAGEHNKDLKQTRARLMRGGSWKKQRIVTILPSSDLMAAKVSLSHWSLAFPPNNGVVRLLALGQEVGDAYSNSIEQVLANPDLSQWEYILTIEADNCPPADGIILLLEAMESHPELSAIGGLYYCKGPNGCAHIWGDAKDPLPNYRPQLPDPNGGVVECCGTSMGFTLFRLSMFKDDKIKRPWFQTLNGKGGTGIGTQDLTFWTEARKHGYRCGVHCGVKVGHYDYQGAYGPVDHMW